MFDSRAPLKLVPVIDTTTSFVAPWLALPVLVQPDIMPIIKKMPIATTDIINLCFMVFLLLNLLFNDLRSHKDQ